MKQVLITGAANGLGRATALEFAHRGWQVLATDIDEEQLNTLAGTDGITAIRMDVTSRDSVDTVITGIRDRGTSLDLIINNAGIDRYFPFSEAPAEMLKDLFDINFFGAVRVTRAFQPFLRRPGGRILFIGSESLNLSLPFMPYPLTKKALESYAKALRQELRFCRIDVVIIRPGAIRTRIIENLLNIRYPFLAESAGTAATCDEMRNAFRRFAETVPGEVGKTVTVEKVASLIYRVSGIRNPAPVYRINNSLRLRLAAYIPFSVVEKFVFRKLR
jgi:NAD(P)-dependent dehydrogenase (short-subunit alcohol dehydrogenase family)